MRCYRIVYFSFDFWLIHCFKNIQGRNSACRRKITSKRFLIILLISFGIMVTRLFISLILRWNTFLNVLFSVHIGHVIALKWVNMRYQSSYWCFIFMSTLSHSYNTLQFLSVRLVLVNLFSWYCRSVNEFLWFCYSWVAVDTENLTEFDNIDIFMIIGHVSILTFYSVYFWR